MKNIFTNISEPDRLKYKRYAKKGTAIFYSLFRFVMLMSIGFIIIYPLFYMIVTSLVSGEAYRNSTRVWIPTEFDVVQNYIKGWSVLEYGTSFLDTLKFQIVSALIEVASCAVIGYGFARFDFKGKKIFTGILFLTILVPDMMLMIPRMLNYTSLDFLGILGLFNKLTGIDIRPNVLNTGLAFWLPSLLGVGLKSGILIYIYIQFFKGLPRELEEAAWVDGAGPIKTFLSIAVPSSSVVFITVFVFSMIWHWNDSLLSSMYLTDDFPLANRLNMIKGMMVQKFQMEPSNRNPETAAILMSACLLFIAPMLIMYMIMQRGFIESIDRVGITG